MCSALARKIKGQRNLANLRAPNAREHCDRARGGSGRGGPPSQIRSFLKTRHEIVASGVILIDILEN